MRRTNGIIVLFTKIEWEIRAGLLGGRLSRKRPGILGIAGIANGLISLILILALIKKDVVGILFVGSTGPFFYFKYVKNIGILSRLRR